MNLLKKYKEAILYVIFGGCTTLVNMVVYFVLYNVLHTPNMFSTVMAWILSVLFAYVTNKLFVFESNTTSFAELLKEMYAFFACRLATGILDIAIMYVFVDCNLWGMEKYNIVVKAASNVIVIILNYVASKLFIFKKDEK